MHFVSKAAAVSISVLTVLSPACSLTSPADGQPETHDSPKPAPTTAYIATVEGGHDAGETASLTRTVLLAMNRAGFKAIALVPYSKPPSSPNPAIEVHARTGSEYCLEAFVRELNVSGDAKGFEVRQPSSEGALRLSREQCANSFARRVASVLGH